MNKEQAKHLKKFACKSNYRPSIECAHIQDGWLFSTDGHRAIIYEAAGEADAVIALDVGQDTNVDGPRIEQVLGPLKDGKTFVVDVFKEFKWLPQSATGKSPHRWGFVGLEIDGTAYALNMGYLRHCIDAVDRNEMYITVTRDNLSIVGFHCDPDPLDSEVLAVVMPLRDDNVPVYTLQARVI